MPCNYPASNQRHEKTLGYTRIKPSPQHLDATTADRTTMARELSAFAPILSQIRQPDCKRGALLPMARHLLYFVYTEPHTAQLVGWTT